jgi:hypothetical protein
MTEAPDSGWGSAGHANANARLVDAARAEIARLSTRRWPLAGDEGGVPIGENGDVTSR